MPVYQVKCNSCGREDEVITGVLDRETPCRSCGAPTGRIPSIRGPNCSGESADWIRSVLEVVDKESQSLHTRRFLKDPTRENYKAWMKGEGIRPLEPGERNRKEEPDRRARIDYMARKRQERNRIEIGR